MTYDELFAAIQSYTENQFPETYLADGSAVSSTTQINTFIQQAEQRIFNTIQFPSLRKNVMGITTNNNKYLSCPSDFLASYSLAVIDADGNYEYLLNKDVNFIRQAYPNPNDEGLPQHYAIFGPTTGEPNELSFIVGPTPDDNYSVELHYYFYPESIVTAGTTWLGDNFESALFNGTMVEAITYMKGEADLVNLYRTRYQESLVLLKNLGDGKLRQDAYRDGQVRVKVQ